MQRGTTKQTVQRIWPEKKKKQERKIKRQIKAKTAIPKKAAAATAQNAQVN